MAMAVTSSTRTSNYHVFLSFRGTDTRYGFTGNLYKALNDKGIHTFFDEEELRSGEEITPALENAIQESRIAIIVLSQDYASSSFCLDELSAIIHCYESKGLLVIPVFYKLDPSDVRHLRGSYGDALTKHERRFPENKLQKWKEALRQVADLSGYHFKDRDTYEYKFFESIVDRVSNEISRLASLHVGGYLVGLESPVQEVMKLLDVGSNDVVLMVGIHGMGGIGKSTLARAVYNKLIAEKFDGSCYLENVREESDRDGLKSLQRILLQEILGDKEINVTSVVGGASMIAERLQRKKVLLVLDDVDKLKQLEAIIGSPEWFGLGSRVIITTRDQHLLACHQVKRIYEVATLSYNDARQLLTWRAFKKPKADQTHVEVLDRVLNYASGLPLALEVIGSHLFGMSVEEWKSAIKGYERIPNVEILDMLKISYNALKEDEKSVFLDISCCFKGYTLEEVQDILHARYGNCMKYQIRVLIEKSLIKLDLDDFRRSIVPLHESLIKLHRNITRITLHDLIEEMGKAVVRQESPENDPGKQSRLWLRNDIIQVLEGNTGTSKIEIIHLHDPIFGKEEAIEWDGNAFKEMKRLEILIIKNGKFSEGPKCLPNSLRVLEWSEYPSNCLPSDFQPRKFVMCNLPRGCFNSFEVDCSLKFQNLKVLKLEECTSLTQIGDVSGLKILENLSFKQCYNLVTVHESVGHLCKVKEINAEDCWNLVSFPPIWTSLEYLNLSNTGLESFPEWRGYPSNCLPSDFQPHKFATCNSPHGCFTSFELDSSSKMFQNLKVLKFDRCSSLTQIGDLSGLTNLEKLSFEYCDSLVTVHESVGHLCKVKEINAEGCRNLLNFPSIHLTSLEKLKLSHTGLESFPEISGKMENIRTLRLSNFLMKELPISFVNFIGLQELVMRDCGSVKLPCNILMMPELKKFEGWCWKGIKWVKEEENRAVMGSIVSSKVSLSFPYCNLGDDFFSIGFTWFAHVEHLKLLGNNFTFLPECIKEFQSLRSLDVSGCKCLQEIRGVPPNVKSLRVSNCLHLKEIRGIPSNVEYYNARDCKSLNSLPGIMLINEEAHAAQIIDFCFPGIWIPFWFEHCCGGPSTSFWFRNKFPTKILCLLVSPQYRACPTVFINGEKVQNGSALPSFMKNNYHTYISDLNIEFYLSKHKVALEKEWNHVEITYADCKIDTSIIKKMGIHVFKEESSKKDIQFTDPCRKRKLEDYFNTFE